MSRKRGKRKGQRMLTDPIAAAQAKHDALSAKVRNVALSTDLPTVERTGRGDLDVEPIYSHAFDHERPGAKAPRRQVIGHAVKDRMASARARLQRFPSLTTEQIAAGVRLEAEYEAVGMEPKMTANLGGAGGGGVIDMAPALIDARSRYHDALAAVRVCGAEVVRIVEAIVIEGATSAEAAAPRYADAEKGRVYAATALSAGLNALVSHYSGKKRA